MDQYSITYEISKKSGVRKPVVQCGVCRKKMVQAGGLRIHKAGFGSHYYKCQNPECPQFGKNIQVLVTPSVAPRFIFVPDLGAEFHERCKDLFTQANEAFLAQTQDPEIKKFLNPKRAGDQLNRLIKYYFCDYRQEHDFDTLDQRESKRMEILDEIVAETVFKSLSPKEKRQWLKALFYASHGHQDKKTREEAEAMALLKKPEQSLDYSRCSSEHDDPELTETLHHTQKKRVYRKRIMYTKAL